MCIEGPVLMRPYHFSLTTSVTLPFQYNHIVDLSFQYNYIRNSKNPHTPNPRVTVDRGVSVNNKNNKGFYQIK